MASDSFYKGVVDFIKKQRIGFSKGLAKTRNDSMPDYAFDMRNINIEYGAAVKRNGSVCLNNSIVPQKYVLIEPIVIGGAEVLITVTFDRRIVAFSKFFPEKELPIASSHYNRNTLISFTRGDIFKSFKVNNRFVIVNDYGESYTIRLDGIFKIAKASDKSTYYPNDEYNRDKDNDYVLYLDIFNSTNTNLDHFYVSEDVDNNTPSMSGEVRVASVNEMGVVSKLSDPIIVADTHSLLFSLNPIATIPTTSYLVDAVRYGYDRARHTVTPFSVKRMVSDGETPSLDSDEILFQLKHTEMDTDPVYVNRYSKKRTTRATSKTSTTIVQDYDESDIVTKKYIMRMPKGFSTSINLTSAPFHIIGSNVFDSGSEALLDDAINNLDVDSNCIIKMRIVGWFDPEVLTLIADGTSLTAADYTEYEKSIDIYAPILGWSSKNESYFDMVKAEVGGVALPTVKVAASPANKPVITFGELFRDSMTSAHSFGELYGAIDTTNYVLGNCCVVEIDFIEPSGIDADFIYSYPVADYSFTSYTLHHLYYDTWNVSETSDVFNFDDFFIYDTAITLYNDNILNDTTFTDEPYADTQFAIWNNGYIISKSQQVLVDTNDNVVNRIYDNNYLDKKLNYGGSADYRVVSQAPSYDYTLKNIAITKPIYQTLRRVARKLNTAQEVMSDVVDIACNGNQFAVIQGARVWVGDSFTLLLEGAIDMVGDVRFIESFRDGFIVFTNQGINYLDRQGVLSPVVNGFNSSTDYIKSASSIGGCFAITETGKVVVVETSEAKDGTYVNVAKIISHAINTVRFSIASEMRLVNGILYISDDDTLYAYNGGAWSSRWVFDGKTISKISELDGEVVLFFYDYADADTINMSSGGMGR